MTAIVIRIALRYLAGALIAKGFLDPHMGMELSQDPQLLEALQIAAGVAVGAISEGWYYLARKLGWAK